MRKRIPVLWQRSRSLLNHGRAGPLGRRLIAPLEVVGHKKSLKEDARQVRLRLSRDAPHVSVISQPGKLTTAPFRWHKHTQPTVPVNSHEVAQLRTAQG